MGAILGGALMRKVFSVVALCSLAAWPLWAIAEAAERAKIQQPTATVAPAGTCLVPIDFGLPDFDAVSNWSLPFCGTLHGTPCQGGSTFCEWTAGEPELCLCVSGSWSCPSFP